MKDFLGIVFVTSAGLVVSSDAPAQERISIAQAKTQIKTMTKPSEAEVRRVDKAAAKLTLRHGELKGIGMPPMTMAFGVSDPTLLDNLKPGDTISFRATDDNGKLTVIELKKLR